MVTLEEGDTLRSEATGETYRVKNVSFAWVHLSEKGRVPRHELINDIKDGKVTKL